MSMKSITMRPPRSHRRAWPPHSLPAPSPSLCFFFLPLLFDEIDDDEAPQVAQAKLARNLVGGLHVGAVGGFLDVPAARRARRVDIDGHEGFGMVDDDRAAGRKRHLADRKSS